MIYYSSKMTIIKIVLFITILSSFGEHKGIQGGNEQIHNFLTFYKRNFDLFHKRCHHVLYIYIYKELYKRYDINTQQIASLDIQKKNQESLSNYHLRLLRLHDSFIDFNFIKSINVDTWTLYILYKRWIKFINYNKNIPASEKLVRRSNILNKAKQFIHIGIQNMQWNDVDLEVEDNIKQVMIDYNYCDETLSFFSEPTNYIEEVINNVILRTTKLNELIVIMDCCKKLTKFGYIMHVMNKDVYEEFILIENTQQIDSYIIQIMKSVLSHIYLVILRLLNEINYRPMNSVMFNQFLKEDNEVANQFVILMLLYTNAIDTTKVLFGVFENESGEMLSLDELKELRKTTYVSLNVHFILNEYYYLIQVFQTKFKTFCPECFKKTIVTDPLLYRDMDYGSNSEGQRSRYTDLPLIFGIYNTCWYTDWMTMNDPDGFDDIEMKNIDLKNVTLKESILLELNVYLSFLHQYAIKIKNYSKHEIMNTFYESHKAFIIQKFNRNQNTQQNPIIIN